MTKAEIQMVRALRGKAGRDAQGLFVVGGAKVLEELLAAKYPFEVVYATAGWNAPVGSTTTFITDAEMERISHLPTPAPVLGVARIPRRLLAPGALDRGWTLALDGIQDPGNVGTIIRIADWYGAERVVLSAGCADPYSPKVIDASMGSFARIPSYTVDLPAVLSGTKAPVLGCDLEGDDVHDLPGMADAVIVIGSEGRGLSAAVGTRISRRITIPGHGMAESLNAAIAAAVVLDNLSRTRSL